MTLENNVTTDDLQQKLEPHGCPPEQFTRQQQSPRPLLLAILIRDPARLYDFNLRAAMYNFG